jgi:hypothetical protein
MPPKPQPHEVYYNPTPQVMPQEQDGANEPPAPAWTEEQNALLNQLKSEVGPGPPITWGDVAKRFPGKSGNACRKHYERLKNQERKQDWDEEKLEKLALIYNNLKKDFWLKVAERMGPGEKWTSMEGKVSRYASYMCRWG